MTDVAADSSTTARVQIGGLYRGVLDMPRDQDWIRIDLTAGQAVRIDMRGRGYDPVSDPLLRLYAADGTILAYDDDGGTGFDAQITYRPAATGTYYISAEGVGSFSDGDYRIDVAAYDGTGTPPVSTNFRAAPGAPAGPLAAIMGDTRLADRVVDVYFGRAGEVFDGIGGEGFTAYERAQFQRAFDQIEAVADVEFRVVTDPAQADFRLVLDVGEMDPDTLGYFYSPGGYGLAGVGVFNGAALNRQPGGNLEPGGAGAATITHELLHGLGLMHPHDTGSGSAVMAGVTDAFDSFGRGGLNQGIYTTMSYNTGHAAEAPSWTRSFGAEIGPMALDIAALQRMYGAVEARGGNTTYLLDAGNGSGTGWQAIWDTGGTDTIVHDGAAGASINLRMANLTYAPGGGGYVSAVDGVLGGYTIARGAVIENARGGWGADRIVGNGAGNLLDGRGGHDAIFGMEGQDVLRGGRGNDRLLGGSGTDTLLGEQGNDRLQGDLGADRLGGGTGADTFVFARASDSRIEAPQRDVIVDFQRGLDRIDLSRIDAHPGRAGNQAFDFTGGAAFDAADRQGDLRLQRFHDGIVVSVDVDGNGRGDMLIEVHGVSMLSAADFIL